MCEINKDFKEFLKRNVTLQSLGNKQAATEDCEYIILRIKIKILAYLALGVLKVQSSSVVNEKPRLEITTRVVNPRESCVRNG